VAAISSLRARSPQAAAVLGSSRRGGEEKLCWPDASPAAGTSPPELLAVQSATAMQRAQGLATSPREPSAARIKQRLFCPG